MTAPATTTARATDDYGLVATIESAHDTHRFCRACGAYNTVVSDTTAVWVECPARARAAAGSRWDRILAALVAHDRILAYDLADA